MPTCLCNMLVSILLSMFCRRYGRSLHARIEQWNNQFSFDSHDPSVYSSPTVTGLIEHYKDPSCCMFFEPMLTTPLHCNFPFDLQHLARAALCSHLTYDSISKLPLPKSLKMYLKEYHYKQRVRIRRLEWRKSAVAILSSASNEEDLVLISSSWCFNLFTWCTVSPQSTLRQK